MHKNQINPSKPIYMTSSELSRSLGYVPHMVTYFVKHWANDPELPCPAPDAYSLVKDGYVNPLWYAHRVPEWQEWDQKRKVVGRRRQREGGQRGKPGTHNPVKNT
jgi:hypothetical protein